MKKSIKISALLLSAFLIIGSCKKKEDAPAEETSTPAPTPTPVVTSAFSAQLNGVAWNATSNSGALVTDADQDLSALALNGHTSSDVIVIGIDFFTADPTLKTGSHDFAGANDDALLMYSTKTAGGGMTTEFMPRSGTVNITAVDNTNKKISGTFNFILVKPGAKTKADSLIITNGVFTNISYNISSQ